MFEVWENRDDPTLHLIFRKTASFPGPFAAVEWIQLGSCNVADDIAADVDRQGFVTMRTNVQFDPSEILGPGLK